MSATLKYYVAVSKCTTQVPPLALAAALILALAAPAALAQFSMDDDAGIPAPPPPAAPWQPTLLGIHAATVSTFRDVPTGAAVFQGGFTSTNAS